MELYLVRHGETLWNKELRIQGHTNSSLTELGIEQAQRVAERLKDIPFDAIYSSDLDRAKKTAEYIHIFHPNLQIIEKYELRERNFGRLEGLTHQDVLDRFPDLYPMVDRGRYDSVIPGGESKKHVLTRSLQFFKSLGEKHAGERVLAVTHGGVINVFFRYVMGIQFNTPRRYILENTAVNIFNYKEGNWRLVTFGDMAHLR